MDFRGNCTAILAGADAKILGRQKILELKHSNARPKRNGGMSQRISSFWDNVTSKVDHHSVHWFLVHEKGDGIHAFLFRAEMVLILQCLIFLCIWNCQFLPQNVYSKR